MKPIIFISSLTGTSFGNLFNNLKLILLFIFILLSTILDIITPNTKIIPKTVMYLLILAKYMYSINGIKRMINLNRFIILIELSLFFPFYNIKKFYQ
ncbi:MAG: hypothetical protein U5K53_03315 [Halanaerobiales bacterium]|nr:hypothetical protein [Halanaerobiales bacterium]